MKIAAFSYTYPPHLQANIGDCIQTLAVEQHLPRVDFHIDRDSLSSYDGEECALVMNGWFSHNPQAWPPSPRIHPIFYGFHMTPEAAAAYAQHVAWFKRFEPIGCRDQATMNTLKGWGVDAYLSLCSTLTFPRRSVEPQRRLVVFADVRPRRFPKAFRSNAVTSAHEIAPVEPSAQYALARAILDFYREKASYVITSRIHAAMPCMAMGIPTLYVGRRNHRTDILREAGVPERSIWDKRAPGTMLRGMRLSDADFYVGEFDHLRRQAAERIGADLKRLGIEPRPS